VSAVILGKNSFLGMAIEKECQALNMAVIKVGFKEENFLDERAVFNLLKRLNPETVYNCFALANVDECETNHELARDLNVLSVENIGKACGKLGIKCVHFSTDYVFDGTKNTPYFETDLCGPISGYGMTKREGELALLGACPNALILRTAWLFGEGKKNFVTMILEKALSEETLEIISDQMGSPTFTRDVAKASLAIRDKQGIFHVVNSDGASRYDCGKIILNYLNRHGYSPRCKKILAVPGSHFHQKAKRPSYSVLANQKINQYLETPLRSFEVALDDFLSEHIKK